MYFMLKYDLLDDILRGITARNVVENKQDLSCIRRSLSAQIHASKVAGKAAT